MNITLTNSLNSDACIKGILAWLSLTQGKKSSEIAEQLLRQLHLLRQTALPSGQRGMLLDLLFAKAEYATRRQIRHLRDITLPISHKARQRVRTLTSCLELLAQDYLIQLAKIFDPDGAGETRPPQIDLAHAMQASSLHIHLNQLIASPPPAGPAQQLPHSAKTGHRTPTAARQHKQHPSHLSGYPAYRHRPTRLVHLAGTGTDSSLHPLTQRKFAVTAQPAERTRRRFLDRK